MTRSLPGDFLGQYAIALWDYLQHPGLDGSERTATPDSPDPSAPLVRSINLAELLICRELASQAIADDLSCVDLTAIHQQAIADYLTRAIADPNTGEVVAASVKALDFLQACLAAYDRNRQVLELQQPEAEAWLRSAFEASGVGLGWSDLEGRWVRANDALCNLVGYTEAELQATNFQTLTHPDDLALDLQQLAQLLRGEIKSYQLQKRYIHKQGHPVWVVLTVSLVRDAAGQPCYLLGQMQNISQQVQLEAEHQRRENLIRNIAAGISAATGYAFFQSLVEYLQALLDVDQVVVSELLPPSYTHGRVMAGLNQRDSLAGLEYELAGTPCEQVVRSGYQLYPANIQELFPNNGFLPTIQAESYAGIGLVSASGKPIGVLWVMHTQPIAHSEFIQEVLTIFAARAGAELERQRSEENLRQYERLVASTPDCCAIIDRNYTYRLINPTYLKWNCKSYDQIVGHTVAELLGEHFFQTIAKPSLDRCIAGATDIIVETWQNYPDGQRRFVRAIYAPYVELDGSISGVTINVHDLTDFKLIEESLRQSEATNQALLQTIPDLLVRMDSHGNYTDVSLASDSPVPTAQKVMVGKNLYDIFPQDLAEQRMHYVNLALATGQVQMYEYDLEIEGQIQYEECRIVPCGQDEVLVIVRNITDRKTAEIALQLSQRQYQSLVDNSPDIIERFDTQLRHRYISPSLTRITGIPAEIFLGKTCRELGMTDGMVCAWEAAAQQVLATGERHTIEFETITLNGVRSFEMAISPERSEQGDIESLLCISRDVSDRKATETMLRQYERIVSATPDAVALIDRNYIYQVVNDVYLNWHGRSRETLIGHSVIDLVGEAMFEAEVQPRLDRCFAGEISDWQLWLTYTGVGRKYVRVIYTPYVDVDGTIVGVVITVHDLTELKQTEEALSQSETRFLQMAGAIHEVFWLAELDFSQILYVSPAYETIWDRSCASLYDNPHSFLDPVHPEDLDQVQRVLYQDCQQGFDHEYRLLHPDGSVRWIWERAFPITDADGKPYRLVGISHDITDRKAVELALLQQQQFTHQIAESTQAILYIYDLVENQNVYVNQQMEVILGYNAQEVQNLGSELFPTLLHPDDIPSQMLNYQRCFTLQDGEVLESEYRMRHKDGSYRWLLSRDSVLNRTADGATRQVLGVAVDITHLKQVQTALRQRVEQEQLLATIAQRVRRSLDLEEILQTTVTEVRYLLQVDRVIIYRFNPDWSGLVTTESVAPGWLPLLNMEITDTFFVQAQGRAYQDGLPRAISDVRSAGLDPCHLQLMEDLQVRAKLIVPILQGEYLWGLLVAQHCSDIRPWQLWEGDLLSQLATQVGIAIQQSELYQQTHRELVHRKRTETALRISQARFAGILDIASDAIISIDTSQRITLFNQGAERIFGYSTGEVLGQPLDMLLPERLGAIHHHHVEQFTHEHDRARRMGDRSEIFARRKDGSEFPAEASISKLTITGEVIFTVILRDITERKAAEAALQQREEILRKLSERVPGFLFQYRLYPNGHSCFPYASEGIRQVYEVTPDQVETNADAVFTIIHPDDLGMVAESIQRSHATQELWYAQYRVVLPQKGLRWLEGQSMPERLPDGSTLWHGYIRDITQRKDVEIALQQQTEREQTLNRVFQSIRKSLDLDTIFATATAETAQLLHVERVQIAQYCPDRRCWRMVATWQQTGLADTVGLEITDVTNPFSDQLKRGYLVQVNATDAIADPVNQQIGELMPGAWVLVPMMVKGTTWGCLTVNTTQQPFNWTPEQVQLVQAVANQLEIAIQQANLYRQTQQQAYREQALNRVVQAMRQSLDLQTILATATAEVTQLLPVEQASIVEYCPDEGCWRHIAAFQNQPNMKDGVGLEIPDAGNPFAEQLKRLEVVRVDDASTIDDPINRELATHAPGAWLLVPVAVNGVLWGSFSLRTNQQERGWQDEEVQLAQTLANQLAIAIAQANLYQRLQAELAERQRAEQALQQLNRELEKRVENRTAALHQQAEQERLLRFVTQRIHESFDLDAIMEESLVATRQTLNADRVALYRFNPDWSGSFVAESVTPGWVPLVGSKVRRVWQDTYLQETQGGRYRNNETLTIHDIYAVGHQQCHIDLLEQFQAKAYAIVPIFVHDQLWGLLAAYQNSAPRHWENREVELMRQIALRMAIAIQQVNLLQQVQTELKANSLLVSIAQTINQAISLDEVLEPCLEEIRLFLGCDRVLVCRLEDGDAVVIEQESVSDPKLSLLNQILVEPCFRQTWVQRYAEGHTAAYADIHTASLIPCHVEFLAQLHIRANLVVGILHMDKLWGLLIAQHCHTPHEWQETEINLVKRAALQIGIAGQKASLYSQLEVQLNQKEVLLKEVHHRVKNNLQVISAMLRMQARSSPDPMVKTALADSQNRLRAISLIHEHLYQSANLERSGFHDYIRRLSNAIVAAHSVDPRQITLHHHLQPIYLNLETAIPCGLLLNELITNAIKHAFPNGRQGEIHITLEPIPSATSSTDRLPNSAQPSCPIPQLVTYRLIVEDNGVGLSPDLDISRLKSLGLKISYDLATQLQGTLEVERVNGTRFQLTFAELEYRKRI